MPRIQRNKKYHISIKQEITYLHCQNISFAARYSLYCYQICSPQTKQGKSLAQREGKQLPFFEEQENEATVEKHNDIKSNTLLRAKISLEMLHSGCLYLRIGKIIPNA